MEEVETEPQITDGKQEEENESDSDDVSGCVLFN